MKPLSKSISKAMNFSPSEIVAVLSKLPENGILLVVKPLDNHWHNTHESASITVCEIMINVKNPQPIPTTFKTKRNLKKKEMIIMSAKVVFETIILARALSAYDLNNSQNLAFDHLS